MCTSCVLFSPWQASVVIRYWRLWEIPTFGGHQVTLARDYVVPNPREFDLREDKFSSSFWQKRCCCDPARAGPPVALRVCRAGSFFCSTRRPAPASHMHFAISWELCACWYPVPRNIFHSDHMDLPRCLEHVCTSAKGWCQGSVYHLSALMIFCTDNIFVWLAPPAKITFSVKLFWCHLCIFIVSSWSNCFFFIGFLVKLFLHRIPGQSFHMDQSSSAYPPAVQ